MLSIDRHVDGATLTLVLEGRLDTGTSKQLDEEIKVIPDNITELVIDMAKLEYLSSSGIRVLLVASKRMDDRGGTCVMANVPEIVMDVFEVTGLLKVFTIV